MPFRLTFFSRQKVNKKSRSLINQWQVLPESIISRRVENWNPLRNKNNFFMTNIYSLPHLPPSSSFYRKEGRCRATNFKNLPSVAILYIKLVAATDFCIRYFKIFKFRKLKLIFFYYNWLTWFCLFWDFLLPSTSLNHCWTININSTKACSSSLYSH